MSEIAPRRYDNLDVRIEPSGGGTYRARVWSETTGEGGSSVDLSPALDALDGFLFNVGQPRRRARGSASTRLKTAQTFGATLFSGIFREEALACLQRSVTAAAGRGRGTRIRLRLAEAPELSDLPWEFLYNRSHRGFLSLSTHTPVVRYLECPEMLRAIRVTPPLRILAVIASPSDYPALDVEREWAALQEALAELQGRGLVALERLGKPQFGALPRALRKAQFHILHFIGHGEFSEDGGGLIFEDEQRRGKMISGDRLGTILRDHASIRLVVLNACEGARASRTDAFGGTAQMLVAQGLPAVLAMQFEITDEAAITIAAEFYTSLAVGDPIDTALAEARRKLFAQQDDGVEWATPVLYLRAADGAIFDVEQTVEVVETREVVREGAPPRALQAKPEVAAPRGPADKDDGPTTTGDGAPTSAAKMVILVTTTLVALIGALALVFDVKSLFGGGAPASHDEAKPPVIAASPPTPTPAPANMQPPSQERHASAQDQQSPPQTQSPVAPAFDPSRAIVGRWSAANASCSRSTGTVSLDGNTLTFAWPRANGTTNVAVESILFKKGHAMETRVESDVNTTLPWTGQLVDYDVQDDRYTATNRTSGRAFVHTRC